MSATVTLLAALVALAAPGPAAAPPAGGHFEVLPGGLELIVLPDPAARVASLRVVVRGGSAEDPHDKAGLAHLLEHLLVRDSGQSPWRLLGDARAAGATLNAFTSRDATLFTLDAPAPSFGTLASRLLRAVTNPHLEQVDVARERKVVTQEEALDDGGNVVLDLLEGALFPARPPETTVLGGGSSRREIERAELSAFYQRVYASSAMTVVLAGAVTVEGARALVDRDFLLPPALPGEGTSPVGLVPALPASLKLRAPFLAAVHGYRLDPADRPHCDALAALVELRLVEAMTLDRRQVRSVEVGCATLRGTPFLLASAFAPTIDASNLGTDLEFLFGTAARRAADARERQVVAGRLERLAARRDADPAALADEVAGQALRLRAPGEAPWPSRPGSIDPEALRAVARRAFTPERRLLLLLSPFEG